MKRKGLWVLGGSILIVLVALSGVWAHMVFSINFNPTSISITKAGVYYCDVTIDPLYEKVGYVLSVDQNSLPENIHAMFMPPVGFFQYANDPPQTIKLIIIAVGQGQGSSQMICNLTQIIPPYDKDEHTVYGPYLSVNISH